MWMDSWSLNLDHFCQKVSYISCSLGHLVVHWTILYSIRLVNILQSCKNRSWFIPLDLAITAYREETKISISRGWPKIYLQNWLNICKFTKLLSFIGKYSFWIEDVREKLHNWKKWLNRYSNEVGHVLQSIRSTFAFGVDVVNMG